MRRKITDEFLKWKNEDQGRTALLVEGARRVGKSYIVEDFARTHYKSYVLIDFMVASPQIKQLFEDHLGDLDAFFARLSLLAYGVIKRPQKREFLASGAGKRGHHSCPA